MMGKVRTLLASVTLSHGTQNAAPVKGDGADSIYSRSGGSGAEEAAQETELDDTDTAHVMPLYRALHPSVRARLLADLGNVERRMNAAD